MKPAPRVLIVDDEESNRTLAERVLRRAGYETAVAVDGVEALRIAEAQAPFDLVLADLVMPNMSGDELARQMLRREPDLKILYFTGYSEQLFANRTALGANETFIEKPVTTKGLVEAVSLALSGRTNGGPVAEVPPDVASQRSLRVAGHAVSVRVNETIGRLANISVTGALVYMPATVDPDRESTMRVDVMPRPLELRVRVVRSHAASVSLPDGMWQHREYAVALAFVDVPPETQQALVQFCALIGGTQE